MSEYQVNQYEQSSQRPRSTLRSDLSLWDRDIMQDDVNSGDT